MTLYIIFLKSEITKQMLIRDDALHNNSITSPHIAETYLSRIHAFTGEMTFFTTLVA
jgi:hypothetical protein